MNFQDVKTVIHKSRLSAEMSKYSLTIGEVGV